MVYKILADAVVIIHFLWILFLLFGSIWGRRKRGIRTLHLGGLVFAVVIQIFGWFCPLTHLEVWLRARHDPSLAYSGSFLVHYIERIIYVEISPSAIFVLTGLLCLGQGWCYLRRS